MRFLFSYSPTGGQRGLMMLLRCAIEVRAQHRGEMVSQGCLCSPSTPFVLENSCVFPGHFAQDRLRSMWKILVRAVPRTSSLFSFLISTKSGLWIRSYLELLLSDQGEVLRSRQGIKIRPNMRSLPHCTLSVPTPFIVGHMVKFMTQDIDALSCSPVQ